MIFRRLLRYIRDYFDDWAILFIVATIVSGLCSFAIQMISTALPLYCVDIGKSTAEAGIFAGFYSLALIVSRPFVGKLTDEKGKFKIAAVGIILLIIAIAGMSFIQNLSLFSLYQAIQGLAYSALSTALAALVVNILPPQSVVKGIGLFTVVKSLTISLGASFAVSFAEKHGSTNIFKCVLAIVVIAFILNIYLKKHKETKVTVNTNKIRSDYKGIEKFVELKALPICLIQFIFTFSLTLATSYLPSYAKEINLQGIGVYYTISAITMLLSRTVLAKYLDKLNNKLAFVVGMFLAIVTTILVLFGNSLIFFIILSIPNAIGICLINPMLNVLATAKVDKNRTGVASSTYYASLDLGSGIGSMLWGILVPSIGFKVAFISASILLVIISIYGISIINKE